MVSRSAEADRLKKEVEDLLSRWDKVVPSTLAPGAPAYLKWDERTILTANETLRFPRSIYAPAVTKQLIIQFFNFYFNGKLNQGVKTGQLVFSCMAMTGYYEDGRYHRYFIDNDFGDNPFFREVTASANVKLENPAGRIIDYTLPESLSKARTTELRATQYLGKDEINRAVFHKRISEMLEKFDDPGENEEKCLLMQLTSFLALVTFRSCCKDLTQMKRAFHKKLIITHLNNLGNWDPTHGYSPPCDTYLSACTTQLNKTHKPTGEMMTKIVSTWKNLENSDRHPKLVALVQATVLTHTAGNGLGLLSFMFGAATVLSVSFKGLMECTLTEKTLDSWKLLVKFGEEFLPEEAPCRTFYWARIISDGYFQEYTAKSHPYLTGTFAGIVSSVQVEGSVEEAEWFKQTVIKARQGLEFGKRVAAAFASTEDSGLTTFSKKILMEVSNASTAAPATRAYTNGAAGLEDLDI
ncbi:nucleocapsid protein [hymenopteran rhabdo-related virus 38]|uniref:Nucleocapsid protein n=1 Tax=hymenopteran rhabdo-related virus 38 TaxID=2847806 RepID=A0A7D7F8E2_9RHAB|nr:nucleocapsid protein [hymenopteran rhabdo-related virus 38]QMP82235.1 nucleocapsid protein [hymenopteran rhabdo-related virus 38]